MTSQAESCTMHIYNIMCLSRILGEYKHIYNVIDIIDQKHDSHNSIHIGLMVYKRLIEVFMEGKY